MGSKNSKLAKASTSPEVVGKCTGSKAEESCNCVICRKEFKKPYKRDTPIVRGPCGNPECEKKFASKEEKIVKKPIPIAIAMVEDVKVGGVNAEDTKAEDFKVDGVKSKDIKAEDLKVDGVNAKDKAKNVQAEDLKVENIKTEDIKVKDFKSEGIESEAVEAEDIDMEDDYDTTFL